MTDKSARSDEYLFDVSETDIEALARSNSPILMRAAERILRDAVDQNDVTTGFNSSI